MLLHFTGSPVIVTVTEALVAYCTTEMVLSPLLEDREHIDTESIRIMVPVNRNVFRSLRNNKSIDRGSFSSVGSQFHARGAATEKALSECRQFVDVSVAQGTGRLSFKTFSFTTGLTTRTLGPSNVFTMLNGCTGISVLD